MPAPDHHQNPASLTGTGHPAKPVATRRAGLQRAISLASGLMVLALGVGGVAHAAGLGRLTVLSGLGQPLRAEIELTSVGRDEAGSLAAHLAPADAYSKSNIEYTSALSTLRFAVAQRPDGSQFISITSIGPVNEPFLDMLIQLDWASGRLVREYTVLLDPPELKASQSAAVAPIVPLTGSTLPPSRRGAPSGAASGTPSSTATSRTPVTPARSGSGTGASGAGGSYEVKRGDTAARIARDNKPDGVTLEQMLVALLRGNPSAFDANNVNRMHTGALLQLPDAAAAKGVDSAEAQRLVTAQASDFSTYRGRLGASAATAPVEEKPTTQAASGKLTAKVDEKQAKGVDAADQLKLSKPGQKGGTGTGTGTAGGKAGGPSAEDLAAKERALKEADERVKLLEKNVSDLQKLLDLKNQNLAQLQKQLDTAQAKAADAKNAQAKASTSPGPAVTAPIAVTPTPAAPVAVKPAVTPTPAPPPVAAVPPPAPTPSPAPPVVSTVNPPIKSDATSPKPADSGSTATPVTPAPAAVTPTTPAPGADATPAPPPALKKPVAPVVHAAPPVVPSDSILDELIDNIYAVVGVIVLIAALIGYFIYNQRRKKKFSKFEDSILTGASGLRANSVFGTTGGQSVDTANSAFNSNFVPMSGQMDTNEVDPVAEADVYIAYGRDAQAEEILKEALRAQPERHAVRLKLLEIYAKRQDSKSFETIASELYAQTGGVGDEWHRAALLGASFDSGNPLYRDARGAPAAASPAAVVIPAPAPYEKTQQLAPSTIAGMTAAAAAGAAGMAAALASTRNESPGATSFPNTLPMEPILDLDLTKTEPISGAQSLPEPAPAPNMDLDFDLGFGDKPAPPIQTLTSSESERVALAGKAAAANNLDFDLDLSGSSESPQAILADGLERTVAINPPPLIDSSVAGNQNFEATVPMAGKPLVVTSAPVVPVVPMVPVVPVVPAVPLDPAAELAHDSGVDFSLDLPPVSTPSVQSATSTNYEKTQPFENSFGGISLDLDQGGVMHAAGEGAAQAAPGKWQDMATKLDLALAYRDIGDKDGARELLEEVLKEGDASQVNKAKELMSALA